MIWLVDPGEYPQQEAEEEWAEAGRDEAPNADTGAFVGYPLPRMVYGVYENRDEAEQALSEISESLQRNVPLRISPRSHRVWLVPADRVHYVVCQEVQRSKDRD